MRPVPEPVRPGQESVWDYPRPPRVESVDARVTIDLGGERIVDTRDVVRVLETSHPPVYYLPIAAFAEDYRVVETPSGCHLTWVMAMKPKGIAGRIGMTLGKPIMARIFQKFLYNLRDYSDARYPLRRN